MNKITTYNITAMKMQTTVVVLLLTGLLVLAATITMPVTYAKKHNVDRTEIFRVGQCRRKVLTQKG
jgi:hypothetical protein